MWMEDNYMLVVQNVQVRNLKLDAKNTEHRFKQGIQREERSCWKMAD
jgi:hypothetical protein